MIYKSRFTWDYVCSYGEHLIAERAPQWHKMSITEQENVTRRELLSLNDLIRDQGGIEIMNCSKVGATSKIYHHANATIVVSYCSPVQYQPTNFSITVISSQPLEEVIGNFSEPYSKIENWRETGWPVVNGSELSGRERKTTEAK